MSYDAVDNTPTTPTPLSIIGAALPRSGTTSLSAALEQLGHKVFHATTFNHSTMGPIWNDIAQADHENDQEAYRAAMDRFVEQLSLEGFTATLDQPSCFVYKDLMKYYPKAKVLKTERDPSSWANSMVEMAYSMDLWAWQPPYDAQWNKVKGPFGYWHKQKLGYTDEEIYPTGVPFDGTNHKESKSSISLASCEAAYHRYQQEVEDTVPVDKLVSFNVKQGWGALCEAFLPRGETTTCPDEPFPQVNSKDDGFLLDWRRRMATKVRLYKIHPWLAQQDWLVSSLVQVLKRWRAVVSFFTKHLGRKKTKTN